MKSILVWEEKFASIDGQKQPVYDLAFKPDGSQLLIAAGPFIHVYHGQKGKIIKSLDAHKDTVYAVDYSLDGRRFASGGADKTVIVWKSNYDPIIKYTHSDSVQCITHNPVSGHVVSCSCSDYGVWSPDQKTVNKFKVGSRITCCAWNADGQVLALGLFSGVVSLRNLNGEELKRIDRSPSPVWSLTWNAESLIIAEWNQRMSFYDSTSESIKQEKQVNYDPCTVELFGSSDLMVVGGSNRKPGIWTNSGAYLMDLCERDGWIWKCRSKPKSNQVAIGTDDGSVAVFEIGFNIVHSIHGDLYAYRDRVCNVVIENLAKSERSIIQLNGIIKQIAIYGKLLAVKMENSIIVYEQNKSEADSVTYGLVSTIVRPIPCNLLVATVQNLAVAHEKTLTLLDLHGEVERKWVFDANLSFIKSFGGAPGKDGLLIGLKNGDVMMVFIHNPYPILCFRMGAAIKCLDLSLMRRKIAAVDANGSCQVYDLKLQKFVFEETGVSSVSWNSINDDMFCYTGNGILSIQVEDLVPYQQKYDCSVIACKGSQIYCLKEADIVFIDVPHSIFVEQYLAQGKIAQAYKLACFGVPESVWYKIGQAALEKLDIDIAKRVFARLQDYKYLDLVHVLQKMTLSGKRNESLLLAEVRIYEGKYQEAAELYRKAGEPALAMKMFTDLEMFDAASEYAASAGVGDNESILKRKAQMQQERNDLLAAAKTYIEIKDYNQAITIFVQNKWFDHLLDLVQQLPRAETKALTRCAEIFLKQDLIDSAAETLLKLNRIPDLAILYIKNEKWEEVFNLAEANPEISEITYIPFANYLIQQGDVQEAMKYFKKAGRNDLAIDVLGRLAEMASIEHRYDDAADLFSKMSIEFKNALPEDRGTEEFASSEQVNYKKYVEYQALAEYFRAYNSLFKYVTEPFSDHVTSALFFMARFLLNADLNGHFDRKRMPYSLLNQGIIYFAAVRLTRQLGAIKTCRFVIERIREHIWLPAKLQKQFNIDILSVKSLPFSDPEDFYPVCWSCGTTNPILCLHKQQAKTHLAFPYRDACIKCGIVFIPSGYSYENVGVIEFKPENGISDQEAVNLLLEERSSGAENVMPINQTIDSNVQTFLVESDNESESVSGSSGKQGTLVSGGMQIFSRERLRKTSPGTIFIQPSHKKCIPTRFFKKALPEMQIINCTNCFKFFHYEDYEFMVAKTSQCPACRHETANS